MKSISPSASINEGYEDLQEQVLSLYRDIATSLGALNTGNNSERDALISEARSLCGRLESLLGLIADEMESPELGPGEIEENCEELLGNAKSIESQLRSIIQRIQNLGR